MQLQHCQTGQIVHSIDDERLTQRGNINCCRVLFTSPVYYLLGPRVGYVLLFTNVLHRCTNVLLNYRLKPG